MAENYFSLVNLSGNTVDAGYQYRSTLKVGLGIKYDVKGSTAFEQQISNIYIYTGVANTHINEKQFGWRSDWTQVMANYMQDWNRVRKSQISTGQNILNSIAISLEAANKYFNSQRKSLYLDTVDELEPSRFGRIEIPDHVDIGALNTTQILLNSAFDIQGPVRFGLPDSWSDLGQYTDGSIEMATGDSVMGGRFIRFTSTGNQRCHLRQEVFHAIPADKSITASIWHKTDVGIDNSSSIYLRFGYMKDDGIVDTHSLRLTGNTSGNWTRSELNVQLTGQSSFFQYSIEMDSLYTGHSSVDVDCPQLELAAKATTYGKSFADSPYWMKTEGEFVNPQMSIEAWDNFASGVTYKIPLYLVSDPDLFTNIQTLAPTRVTSTPSIETGLLFANKLYGFLPHEYDRTDEKGWAISSTGESLYTYRFPNTKDVYEYLKFADPGVTQSAISKHLIAKEGDVFPKYVVSVDDLAETGNGYTLNIEAFTIRYDKIWAVCAETRTGYSARILKVASPFAELNRGYVETIKDYVLATGADNIGLTTAVAFSQSNPDVLEYIVTGDSMTTAQSGVSVKLHYDYCYLDSNNRTILTRDLYTGSNQSIVIV